MISERKLLIIFIGFILFDLNLKAGDIETEPVRIHLKVQGEISPGKFYSRRKAIVSEVWLAVIKSDSVDIPEYSSLRWRKAGRLTYKKSSPGYVGYLGDLLQTVREEDFYSEPVLLYCSGEWEAYNCYEGWYLFEYPEEIDVSLFPGDYTFLFIFSVWNMKKDLLGGRSLLNQVYLDVEPVVVKYNPGKIIGIEATLKGFGLEAKSYQSTVKVMIPE